MPEKTLGRLLFFRHGILINRWFTEPMARHFRGLGYDVRNASYPSRRKTIQEHAEDLHREITAALTVAEGEEHPRVDVITHSLGGLILRYALTHHDIPAMGRAVLIAPPNRGSVKARYFRDDPVFKLAYGDHAGRQLTEEPDGIFAKCGIPQGVEIGIIAGVATPAQIFPAPLPAPHDGVVSLEETRLGSFPVCTVAVTHTACLLSRTVWRRAGQFLRTGTFADSPGSADEVEDREVEAIASTRGG